MSIQHIEELRAELRGSISSAERAQITKEITLAGLKEAAADALEFKNWALNELLEARTNNLNSVLGSRETQYTEACKDAAAAQVAYDEARGA